MCVTWYKPKGIGNFQCKDIEKRDSVQIKTRKKDGRFSSLPSFIPEFGIRKSL